MSSNGADGEETSNSSKTDCAADTVDNSNTLAPTSSEKAESAAKAKLYLERAKLCSITSAAVEDITSRLSGGNFGDITVDGSKDTHPNGHRELFQLRELFNKVIDFQAKQLAIDEKIIHLKENPPQKGADSNAKMSASNVRVMETVIDQKTNDKFRDISIKFEEVSKRLSKSEKRNEELESELEALKTKVKKSAGGNQHPSMTQHQGIVGRVAKLEEKQDEIEDVRRDISIIETKHDEFFRDQSNVQRQVNHLETEVWAQVHDINGRVEELEAVNTGDLREKLRVAEAKIKKLEKGARDSKAEWKKEIKELTDWVQDVSDFEDGLDVKTREWIARLNRRIRVVQSESGHLQYDNVRACDLWEHEDVFSAGRELREQ